jgi:hypothetical protein
LPTAANTDWVAKLQSNLKIFGRFVGQVVKATQDQANAQLVNEALKRLEGQLPRAAAILDASQAKPVRSGQRLGQRCARKRGADREVVRGLHGRPAAPAHRARHTMRPPTGKELEYGTWATTRAS